MKPLVSIIVPVYKVEDYLKRCLDSLRRQSLRDIEIVLVDDASPDDCSKICEEYASKDIRFKVIHHSVNRGLSVARNTGIHSATADYLMFVDSDDWVHEDFCKLPYECSLKYHADVVMFNRLRVNYKRSFFTVQPLNKKIERSGYKSRKEAMDLLHVSYVDEVPWNKLYKKALFEGISYPEGFFMKTLAQPIKLYGKRLAFFILIKFCIINVLTKTVSLL